MLVDFNNLPDTSKVWIYQSSREFNDGEISQIGDAMEAFIANWQRHGTNLQASYQIRYNLFVILAVDDSIIDVSGCSVDASTHVFKKFEEKYQVDFFNKLNTAFKDGDIVNIVSLSDFQKYIKEQKITDKTIVFNNLIETKKELDTAWEIPAVESWHKRFL